MPVLAISPDGSKFVYAANGRLYLRSLSGLQATPIAGTETPQFSATIQCSPQMVSGSRSCRSPGEHPKGPHVWRGASHRV